MARRRWLRFGLCAAVVAILLVSGFGSMWKQHVAARTNPENESTTVDRNLAADDLSEFSMFPQVLRMEPLPMYAPAFFDDFSNPLSGWYVGDALRFNVWSRYPDGRWEVVATMDYFDSSYRTFIPLTFHGNDYGEVDSWFVRPVHFAPLPDVNYPLPERYCIQVDGYFSNWLDQEKMPWWATWGLVFGANEAKTEIYTFQINANHDRAALYYHNYEYPGDRQPIGTGEQINVEIPLMGWLGHDFEFITSHRPNTLRAVVKGENLKFYVNDQFMGAILVSGMARDRVGVIVTSWETTPVEVRMDNFRFDPQCAEAWE